jgi:DNA topoisomerase-1
MFEARLTTLAGSKLDKFDLENATQAEMAVQAVNSRDLSVLSVEAKPGTRNPSAPFMTSTLQQEASRKFGMGARQTMNSAQRLYEAGHITYMRTDGIDMAPEAVHAARDAIKSKYGEAYVPKEPRMYKNKAKNAQEAHECIRPTDMMADVSTLKIIDADQRKLYDLIYKRTISSQMSAARLERTTVIIGSNDKQVEMRASGQVVEFDGFLKIYEEGRDEPVDDDDARLPQINQGDALKHGTNLLRADFDKLSEKSDDVVDDSAGKMNKSSAAILSDTGAVLGQQHHTQPPPRFTEATLVKRMEELGIGRPSTYASIVTTIQDRAYVRKDKNRLIPEDKGRLVTVFLTNFFKRYVEFDFTASLEAELDDVSAGDRKYKNVLERFWRDFAVAISEAMDLSITEVLEKINDALAPHIFPAEEDGSDPRLCKNCVTGRLSMRTARSGGAFIGCSNYPECKYTRPFGPPGAEDASGIPPEGKELGIDDGDKIYAFKGRFGPYVQRGEATEENNKKPPRQSIPQQWPPETVDLPQAVKLLALPRLIDMHPEDGIEVWATIGRYGPYLKHNKDTGRGGFTAPLEEIDEVWTVGMNRAVQLLAEKKASRRGGAAAVPIKELGEHPDEGGPVNIYDGKYGAYVKHGKINATIPETIEVGDMTLDEATILLAEKAAKSGTKKRAAPKKKAAAKKPATKKKPAAKKKPSAKKAD